MPAKSRVLNDMIMKISYNAVGADDDQIVGYTPTSEANGDLYNAHDNGTSSSGPSTTTSASNSNHSKNSSLSTIDNFPPLGPAKHPMKPFPTNPQPFPGLARNCVQIQPSAAPEHALEPAPVMQALPPPRTRCTSSICNIEAFHEAKPFSAQDKSRPKYVKELEDRLRKAKGKGLRADRWWENEFLDVFYSVHWAGGAMVIPDPSEADKFNGHSSVEKDGAKKDSGLK
ncbi:MAG: hypothetical protein HETSPECPRED_000509 [Heterodermia speciosa]|uniref:Uncharacterized protein n=1 Tax=Heterodermia speciosa TaxID=116794 RepID=A0A8H3GA13_9LECA|nr:MAG: hypothetical protein HETSPECPRED_000509 [Heterodermia speciosa]